MGRANAGVPFSAIQAELTVLSRQIQRLYHADAPSYRAIAYPLHQAQRGLHSSLFELFRVLAVAVFILLLLACFNAANLLMGRATERAREIGVRISLGVGRARIIRQLLTESFAIAVAAALLGLLLVYATRSSPYALAPTGLELYLNLDFDWTVVLFLFGITAVTTFLFGLLPALETGKVDVAESLKEGSGNVTAGSRRNLWRRALVIGQVALATLALFAGALFTEYTRGLMNTPREASTARTS